MIRAGTMRHLISIYENQEVTGVQGGISSNLVKVKEVRASINPVTGNEIFINDTLTNEVTHKIGIRYINEFSLTPKYFIEFGSRVFDIIQVLNFQEKKVNLIILAKERL